MQMLIHTTCDMLSDALPDALALFTNSLFLFYILCLINYSESYKTLF